MNHLLGCTTRPYASLTFSEACKHIRAAGYTDVAVFGNADGAHVHANSTPDQIRIVRDTAANAALAPSMLMGGTQLQLGLHAAVNEYKRLIDNTAAMGAKWLLDCGTSNTDHYEDYYELMRRVAPHADQAGVNITRKPHGGNTLNARDLMDACHQVKHRAFGICYDPGNIIYYSKGEHRPETDLDSLAPMVTTVIIKDCVIRGDEPEVMITPGEGLVDFAQVIDCLIRGGFLGPFYVECVSGDHIDEINANVNATYKFLRRILSHLPSDQGPDAGGRRRA